MLKKLNELPKKEKYALIIGVAILAGVLIFQLFISGSLKRGKTLRRVMGEKRSELVQMKQMFKEHRKIQSELEDISERLAGRDKDFAIFAFLEQVASDLDIKGNIAHMKPRFFPVGKEYSESVIELKLEDVTLGKITRYLYEIEKSGNLLNIKRLNIKANSDDSGYLDVVFEVSTLVSKEG